MRSTRCRCSSGLSAAPKARLRASSTRYGSCEAVRCRAGAYVTASWPLPAIHLRLCEDDGCAVKPAHDGVVLRRSHSVNTGPGHGSLRGRRRLRHEGAPAAERRDVARAADGGGLDQKAFDAGTVREPDRSDRQRRRDSGDEFPERCRRQRP